MKIRTALATLLLSGLLLLPLAGSAKSLDEQIDITSSGDMSSWGFSPSPLTVQVGATVTWKNTGTQAHSVTSRDQLFDSRLLDGGESWSYTFDTPGTYRYFCVPHPWMKGSIVVTASDDDTPRRASVGGDSSATAGASSSATATPSPTGTP